ncbi:MAG: DUF6178 family protein [Proteobacteria bacterium]|nr:DUF6178 family protein [Pseudomonadota bacterium]
MLNQSLSLRQADDRGIHTFRLKSYFKRLRNDLDIITPSDLKPLTGGTVNQTHGIASITGSTSTQLQRISVQNQPIYHLYLGLLEQDEENLLTIMNYLSQEQLTHLLDLDAWQDDLLNINRAVAWLKPYAKISSQVLYQRFASLDEEYQVLIFSGLVHGYSPEDMADLPTTEQDQLFSLPQGAYYYKILSDHPQIIETTLDLISALEEQHMEHVLSLFAHIQWLPEWEVLERANRFRIARLEELGFSPQQRARANLHPYTPQAMTKFCQGIQQIKKACSATIPNNFDQQSLLPNDQPDQPFIFAVLHYLNSHRLWSEETYQEKIENWLFCTNQLSSALGIHPSKSTDRDFLFEHILAAASLALDELSGHNLMVASQILKQTSVLDFMKYTQSRLKTLKKQIAQLLQEYSLVSDSFDFFVDSDRYALIQQEIAESSLFFGLQNTELLKGFFNRFTLLLDDSESHGIAGFHSVDLSSQTHNNKKQHHLYFYPLTTSRALQKLTVQVSTLLWITKLVLRGAGKNTKLKESSLHRLLMRSLASVSLGNKFRPRIFDQHLTARWQNTSLQDKAACLSTFIKALPSVASEPSFALLWCDNPSNENGAMLIKQIDLETKKVMAGYQKQLTTSEDLII